jgi:hypothetical protein
MYAERSHVGNLDEYADWRSIAAICAPLEEKSVLPQHLHQRSARLAFRQRRSEKILPRQQETGFAISLSRCRIWGRTDKVTHRRRD